MHPVYGQLALAWLEAEQAANPLTWGDRPVGRDEMSVAIDRVIAVVSGDVTWSDASPGDKAVWKSRVSDIPQFARTWRSPIDDEEKKRREALLTETMVGEFGEPVVATPRPRGPRIHGVRERLWWTYYDTLEDIGVSGRALNYTRLFGNANIGNIWLTNLQVAGQLGGDSTFLVCAVWASISQLECLHWAADNILFEFSVGSRRALPPMKMMEAFRGVDLLAPSRRPYVIPVRQDFSCQVGIRRTPPPDLPHFDVTFHFEGLQTRDIQ